MMEQGQVAQAFQCHWQNLSSQPHLISAGAALTVTFGTKIASMASLSL
ncbi:hypothetical protein [Flindersiella endophytica]